MELLDIVDENDKPTGQKATRDECHEKNLRHRVVQIYVFRRDGRVVLCRRSAKRKHSPLFLDATAGGHVKSGESYGSAVKREMEEELGIDLEIKFLMDIPKGMFHTGKCYYAVYDGLIKPDKREIESTAEVHLGETLELMEFDRFTPEAEYVLRKLREMKFKP